MHGTVSTTLKLFLVAFLALLLMIPLALIDGLLGERRRAQAEAERSVAVGWGGEQTLVPLYLTAPQRRELHGIEDGKPQQREVWVEQVLLADQTGLDVHLESERRQVGLYEVMVYTARIELRGRFAGADLARFATLDGIDLTRARVELALSDLRGLHRLDPLRFGTTTLRLVPVAGRFAGLPRLGSAELPIDWSAATDLDYTLSLELAGTHAFGSFPLAREFGARIAGDWPHPSFVQGALPRQRSVAANGFAAEWQSFEFNRALPQQFEMIDHSRERSDYGYLGVALKRLADPYQQNERSGKYAYLFLALSLLGFVLVEAILRVRLHPVHYGLIGLSLVQFYLLLLALSEHLGFAVAYAGAATLVVVTVGGYCAAVLRGARRGLVAGAVLAVVYGFLYVLVASESYALLLGALGLFALSAAVMYLTRRVDWYAPNAPPPPTA